MPSHLLVLPPVLVVLLAAAMPAVASPALSSSSSPSPASSIASEAPAGRDAAAELSRTLQTAETHVEVTAASAATGCTFERLALTPTARRTVSARLRLRGPTSGDESLAVTLSGQGSDARGYRCRRDVQGSVVLTSRAPRPAPGTRTTLVIEGPGFVIDSPGVVVPCRRDDLALNPDAVCARSETGRVLVGCIDPEGPGTLISPRCTP
jgi:hypothetical protein